MGKMEPYLLVFKVKPQPDNPQAQDIGGAHATIFVFDKSAEAAYEKAKKYLNAYGWEVEGLEHAFEPTAEQISQLDTVLMSVYRKAELNGISSRFDAWPKQDRPGVYSVETLRMPPKK